MNKLPFLKSKYIKPKEAIEFIYENEKVDKKSIKSVAIFASFSSKGIISESDLYTINDLCHNFDAVIVIYDSHVLKKEIKKIEGHVFAGIFKRHEKYDFGSYSIGYKYLMDQHIIENLNHLVLMNNSCYGPIYSLSEYIEKMKDKADFSGMSLSPYIRPHIQSWFYFFNKKVIESGQIWNFIKNIKSYKLQDSFVTHYERKFTMFLAKQGFSYLTYLPSTFDKHKFRTLHDPCFYIPEIIVKYHFPFVRKKLFDPYFYDIVDNRYLAISTIEKENKELYLIIMKDLKNNHKNLDFIR